MKADCSFANAQTMTHTLIGPTVGQQAKNLAFAFGESGQSWLSYWLRFTHCCFLGNSAVFLQILKRKFVCFCGILFCQRIIPIFWGKPPANGWKR